MAARDAGVYDTDDEDGEESYECCVCQILFTVESEFARHNLTELHKKKVSWVEEWSKKRNGVDAPICISRRNTYSD